MAFINPVWFKVELLQATVMDFIGGTPPQCYFLIPAGGGLYYGMFLYEDMLEYLTNEFTIWELVLVTSAEVKKVLTNPDRKVWGSRELLNF